MHKSLYTVSLIISLSLATNAIAHPFLFSSPTKQLLASNGNISLPPVSNTTLSPSEFNARVSKLSAENQKAFQQQLSQRLSNLPTASTSPGRTETIEPPKMPAASYGISNAPSSQPSTISSTPQPPPLSKEVYTGFGSGTTGTTPAPAPQQRGTGSNWNIRY